MRPYKEGDLEQIVKVYQSAFAEPPWNEYLKCVSCGVEYGRRRVKNLADYCRKCEKPINLVKYWPKSSVVQDLDFALSQRRPIALVAENSKGLVGFAWGYKLSLKKIPLLKGMGYGSNTNYLDDIAVKKDARRMGMGSELMRAYLEQARKQGMKCVVLRTDWRNKASMTLFKKSGFREIEDEDSAVFCRFENDPLYDPEFPNRIYMEVDLKWEEEDLK